MKTLWLTLLAVTTCAPPWIAPELPAPPAARICAALERLCGAKANATPEGASCRTVYDDVAAGGIDLTPAANCAEQARTCGQALDC